jgi:hypothetical protein
VTEVSQLEFRFVFMLSSLVSFGRLLKKGICHAERIVVMLRPPRRTQHLALVRPSHAKTQSQILRGIYPVPAE